VGVVESSADDGAASSSADSGRSTGRETARRVLLLLVGTSNVTSAFSVLQETLFMLNNAMMVTESRVILNLLDDALNTFGRPLPIVAFLLIVPFSTSEVTQLLSPDTVHCEPVYPFEHTHEHSEPLDTLTPPFWQGFVVAQEFVLL
jgi:hypothetical protein